ncbi:MAG: hypothetical protein R3F44_14775 [Candidatus Competibacteraceae bacterium]
MGRHFGARLLYPRRAVRPRRQSPRHSALDELVVTDTIPLRPEAVACPNIRQIGVAGLLAETMRRIHL